MVRSVGAQIWHERGGAPDAMSRSALVAPGRVLPPADREGKALIQSSTFGERSQKCLRRICYWGNRSVLEASGVQVLPRRHPKREIGGVDEIFQAIGEGVHRRGCV